MAFFEERIEKGLIAKLQGIIDYDFVRMDYTEAIGVLQQATQKFEFPVNGEPICNRSTNASSRRARQEARDPDELSEGDQGVLHAAQRRR